VEREMWFGWGIIIREVRGGEGRRVGEIGRGCWWRIG